MTQTLDYMIDVMTRAKAGEWVQERLTQQDVWVDVDTPYWNWAVLNYRIKPREPRVIYVEAEDNGKLADNWLETDPNVREKKQIKFREVLDDE